MKYHRVKVTIEGHCDERGTVDYNLALLDMAYESGVLLERYGIEDSAIGLPAGEFSDPAIRSLYEELIARGSASLEEAAFRARVVRLPSAT